MIPSMCADCRGHVGREEMAAANVTAHAQPWPKPELFDDASVGVGRTAQYDGVCARCAARVTAGVDVIYPATDSSGDPAGWVDQQCAYDIGVPRDTR